MSKKTKRLVGIAAAVVLAVALCIAGFVMAAAPEEDPVCYIHGDVNGDGKVNKDDAIYLLYASFPGLESEFPMNQDGEMDNNDAVNKDDAIYLLYASVPGNEQSFPLKGEVHSYYDPTWVWDEDAGTAKVTFKCGCSPEGHAVAATVTVVDETPATCVKAGSRVLSAKATFDGKDYVTKENKTVVIPATKQHALNEASCTVDLECANCDYKVAAPGHSMALLNTIPATCSVDGKEVHKCANCDHKEEVVLTKLGHALTYLEGQDVEKADCVFVKRYSCSTCFGVFEGENAADTYTKHTYVTELTKEITCSADGEKTTACDKCGHVQSKEILPKDISKHAWDSGVPLGNKITFSCTQDGCDEEKVEVIADAGKVDTTTLSADTGVNLGNKTSVAMDQTVLSKIGNQEITISVEQKAKAEIAGLSAEQQAQIPSETVYDFTITDGEGQTVSDFGGGMITVTLPYKLQDGDDINSIDIWYITDDGQTNRVSDAVYSNGFVTFQTGHFSYYTVTRLTPVERCARLNKHIEVQQVKAATCTEDGYNMTACQRCGEIISKEIFEKTGHKYQDSQKDPSCLTDGLLTRTCTNGCGHVITKTLPALGHDKKQDTVNTVAATCNATGKSVEACSRCDYTAEEPLAQLKHNYEKSDEKSVAATCSAAGYDVYVCSLCGDEQRKNDTAPLGHSFVEKKDGWKWTDHTNAVVTLVCENDPSHTKELSAVVVKNEDKSQNTSCLGSGSVVYEAAVSYNGKTYTSVNEITVAAPGHKPGTAWESSATQHYHLCTVCGEKQGAEAHAWNEGTVTKEPTCKEAGSKNVQCSVCNYEKAQTIPATGKHNFVNGVCSGCGTVESDCRHLPVNKSLVDVDALGLCDGAEFYRYSCDCGQVVEYEISDYRCEFGETIRETVKDEYGFAITTNRATCKDCGMEITMRSGETANAEACESTYFTTYAFYKDGALIAEQEVYTYKTNHPGVTELEKKVIQNENLCGDITVTVKKCFCGKYSNMQVDAECMWGWGVGPGFENENHTQGMCYECGATWDEEWTEAEVEGVDCGYEQHNIATFAFGQEVLYFCEYDLGYIRHNNVMGEPEMLGEKCTDGIILQVVCEDCGLTTEDFIRNHETCQREIIELDGEFCSRYVTQFTCLCEEAYADYDLDYNNGNGCEMEWAFDKELQQEFWMCYECGLKRYQKDTYGEKDADCVCLADTVYTFKNAEGVTVATANRRYNTTAHDMKTEAKLMEGAQNCEEGVMVRNYCTDCSFENSYETNYHEQYLATTYDTSAFDACFTKLELYRCACGQESYFEKDQYCQQDYVDSEVPNQEQWKCNICGVLESVTYSYPESDDPCLMHVVKVYDFSKEGVETTIHVTLDEYNDIHDYIYELQLDAGATDCNGGFTATGSCRRCGKTNTHTGRWHNTYVISMERVDGDKMCGQVFLETVACACGQNSDTQISFDGDVQCQFNPDRYDQEMGTWLYTCATCGSYYYEKATHIPSETDPCRTDVHTTVYYCDKDGNNLFEYTREGWFDNHEFLVEFLNPDGTPWSGTDCSQGYKISQHCLKCGETRNNEYVRTYCENFTTKIEVLYDGTDMCGPLKLRHYGCPCGKQGNIERYSDCNWRSSYDEQAGKEKWTCSECGAYYYAEYVTTPIPGSLCKLNTDVTITYYVGDKQVATAKYSNTNEQHTSYYIYDGKPASCEDGWGAESYCMVCGKYLGRTENNYFHDTNTVQFYNLSEQGMCGGYLTLRSCACGQKTNWSTELNECDWSYINGTENSAVYHCDDCDTYSYRTETGETDDQCNYVGTLNLKFVREEQTLLEVDLPVRSVRHSERVVDAWLMNPGTSCTDGINLRWECRNCDYYYISEDNYHYRELTDRIETACGTTIERDECSCGERATIYRSNACAYTETRKRTGDDWNGTETLTQICEDCGLEMIWDITRQTPEGSCEGIRQGTITVKYGDKTYGLTFREEITNHRQMKTQYSLKPGATTCIGNLIVTDTCSACGYNHSWNASNEHRMNLVSTLDLKSYGATCGGSLRHYECPCGAVGRYDIDNDSLCKLQQSGEALWIEDALNEELIRGTDGNKWLYSYAWTYTCAVTEPACNLRLRMAEYWLAENCIATEYQTWQYFDASQNQWVEIDTIPTGDTTSFHNYTEEEVNTTEDGAKVTGTRYICACGAYCYDLRYEYADGTYKQTYDAVDGKGCNRYTERHDIAEYFMLIEGGALVTHTYNEYTYDGITGWTKHEYEYDVEAGCKITDTATYSNGEPHTSVRYHYDNSRTHSTVQAPTCTQPGTGIWEDHCAICKKVCDSGTYEISPSNHSWFYNGEAGWKCYNCDLEDRNGASEGIILEDLTEELGAGTNYVAGYWNKDEVSYIMSVCAVVEGQDPIYLDGIQLTEHGTATAVCFNIADAHAAADALVNGAAYQLRLNFVTTEGERMEYAITFTDARAQ